MTNFGIHYRRLSQVTTFAKQAQITFEELLEVKPNLARPRHEVVRRFRHRIAIKFQRIRCAAGLTFPTH